MTKVLCDTNILISLFRGLPDAIAKLNAVGDENILISSISIMELYRDMTNKKELSEMKKKIDSYNIIHFNESVSVRAMALVNDFNLSHNLQMPS